MRIATTIGWALLVAAVPSIEANAADAGDDVPRSRRAHGTAPTGFVALPTLTDQGDRLTGAQVAEDLDQLEHAIETRFAYAKRKTVDHRGLFDGIRAARAAGTNAGQLALDIQAILSRYGDGHSQVEDWDRALGGAFSPFLVADSDAGPVAFADDRTRFVDEKHPILESIDGVPLENWLAAAARLVPAASPAFVRWHGLRALRFVGALRMLLGTANDDSLEIGLRGLGGARTTVRVPTARKRPKFGDWPRTSTRILDGGVVYWRVADMDGSAKNLTALDADADVVSTADRLIIDVRGNGGGDREVSLRILRRMLPPSGGPRVVNAAVYRRAPGEARSRPGGWLANRSLFPIDHDDWTADERRVASTFERAFKPEWSLAADEGSDVHVAVVTPTAGARPKRIAVLLDAACFSATDVFLGGIAGTPGVTLVGSTSGGGSGRAKTTRLSHSRIEVRLSTMVSYRPDGRLFDGRGVEPDVAVLPAPTDWIGRGDRVLDRAIEVVRR